MILLQPFKIRLYREQYENKKIAQSKAFRFTDVQDKDASLENR